MKRIRFFSESEGYVDKFKLIIIIIIVYICVCHSIRHVLKLDTHIILMLTCQMSAQTCRISSLRKLEVLKYNINLQIFKWYYFELKFGILKLLVRSFRYSRLQ